jgi:hypothetical protein
MKSSRPADMIENFLNSKNPEAFTRKQLELYLELPSNQVRNAIKCLMNRALINEETVVIDFKKVTMYSTTRCKK